MVATTTTSPSKPLTILILGGGIAGLTLSLALTKFSPPNLPPPTIKIFEIRPQPATIGGAVNLTPNALRLLDHLGALSVMKKRGYGKVINAVEIFDIYSGVRLGESAFRGPNGEGIGEPPYKALRITRGDSLKAVLEVIETKENIELRCGMKTVEIEEQEGIDGGVTLRFENGEVVRGNLLIGCDGIHSVTRLTHVEPERKAVYSGIANAFGFAKNPALRSDDSKQAKEAKEAMQEIEPHFECTAMHFARRGMMLTSFFNEECEEVYVGALMQWPEVTSRDGWKAVGQETEKVRQEMRERFVEGAESGGGKLGSFLRPVVDEARDVFLWPVYTLSKEGRWSTERVMLLGDAVSLSFDSVLHALSWDVVADLGNRHTQCHHKANPPVSSSKTPYCSRAAYAAGKNSMLLPHPRYQ